MRCRLLAAVALNTTNEPETRTEESVIHKQEAVPRCYRYRSIKPFILAALSRFPADGTVARQRENLRARSIFYSRCLNARAVPIRAGRVAIGEMIKRERAAASLLCIQRKKVVLYQPVDGARLLFRSTSAARVSCSPID